MGVWILQRPSVGYASNCRDWSRYIYNLGMHMLILFGLVTLRSVYIPNYFEIFDLIVVPHTEIAINDCTLIWLAVLAELHPPTQHLSIAYSTKRVNKRRIRQQLSALLNFAVILFWSSLSPTVLEVSSLSLLDIDWLIFLGACSSFIAFFVYVCFQLR